MMHDMPQRVMEYIANLIGEAQTIITENSDGRSLSGDTSAYMQLVSGCQHLAQMLGPSLSHWRDLLAADSRPMDTEHWERLANVDRLLGVLWGLQRAITHGVLQSVADLIRAETFGDLLYQADYLLEERFALPAAVI